MSDSAQVIASFEARNPIVLQQVVDWLKSDDLEVCGATCACLGKQEFSDLIQPRLDPELMDELVVQYLLRCLVEKKDSDWVHTKYEASWALADWFNKTARNAEYLYKLEIFADKLRDLYLLYPDLRMVLVNGLLEHICSSPASKKIFNQWKGEPLLNGALQEAGLWREKGGQSPVDFGRFP